MDLPEGADRSKMVRDVFAHADAHYRHSDSTIDTQSSACREGP